MLFGEECPMFYFQLQVEVAKAADVPFPPPLDEGVTESLFSGYIVTPPASPVPEVRPY